MVERIATEDENLSGEGYIKIAKELRSLGELNLALQSLERGLAAYPNVASLHVTRGELLVKLFNKHNNTKYLKSALLSFNNALKLDPNNYLSMLISAQIYLKGRAVNRSKILIANILKIAPDDEKAKSLLKVIRAHEAKVQARLKPPTPASRPADVSKSKPVIKAKPPIDDDDSSEIVVVDKSLLDTSDKQPSSKELEDSGFWETASTSQVVISATDEDSEDKHKQNILSDKTTVFSRLDGLKAIFLIDGNGIVLKVVNKDKKLVDENKVPSLVHNIQRTSSNGMRRTNLGSFQRGILSLSTMTFVIVNVFYATLVIIIDNDSNLETVETRLKRYLEEVTF
ncbi:MAG: tetratricopeptide repeat protein [Nitrospinota bacterium]